MKKNGILNSEIMNAIAALGHTEYICIADCGLPIPRETRCIDVSITAGLPRFDDVLNSVCGELVVESYIIASEIRNKNPQALSGIEEICGSIPRTELPHEEFKRLLPNCKCVIRTGETSPYANIILVGGVNF